MRLRMLGLAIALLLGTASAYAHHALQAEFDTSKRVEFTGVLTRFALINPHTQWFFDVKKPDGTVENWAIEAGSPNILMRRGITKNTLKRGDKIVIDGYQSKDGSRRANGRDLTLPNGQHLFLGSSGPGEGAPFEVPRPGVDVK